MTIHPSGFYEPSTQLSHLLSTNPKWLECCLYTLASKSLQWKIHLQKCQQISWQCSPPPSKKLRKLWQANKFLLTTVSKKLNLVFSMSGLDDLLASWGFCNKLPQTGWLKRTEIHCLGARNLISRCWQDHALSEDSKRISFLTVPRGQQLVVANNSWHSLACGNNSNPCFCLHIASSLCIFVQFLSCNNDIMA